MARKRRYKKRSLKPRHARAVPLFEGFARGLALFLGAFSLLNVIGQSRYPGFDANYWWIDFTPVHAPVARIVLAAAAVVLLAWAVRPPVSRRRRTATLAFTTLLLVVTISNSVRFYVLLWRRAVAAGFPLAFSLIVSAALAVVLAAVLSRPPERPAPNAAVTGITLVLTLLLCLVGFPVAQMFCFGRTDYRRPADAIVVFGARVYADGRPSDALADRLRTACRLHNQGLARWLIVSGGPGDGPVHETRVMQQMALELGVPADAVLLDPDGLNTQATVDNTTAIFDRLGIKRVLAVSHFYHLPRIKMTYQRAGRQVFTVPATESYRLSRMPQFILREVAALWLYYLRPLAR